jgi:hypothetical protein
MTGESVFTLIRDLLPTSATSEIDALPDGEHKEITNRQLRTA